MRILHVITGLGRGGAETVLYRLATGSTRATHEVICLEAPGYFSTKLEEAGIPVHHVGWGAVGSVRALFRLHKLVRSLDADVVQTWMYRANVFGGLSAKLVGSPIVWNIRCSSWDVLPLPTQLLAHVGGFLARFVPRRVINCSAVSRRLHARLGYDAADGVVIPNGYDPALFGPDEQARDAIRQELNVPSDGFVLATIGRWHVQKGLPELLQAVRILRDRKLPVTLLMVGRDLDEGNGDLTDLIARTGGGEALRLLGNREDVADLARAADLHVLASIGAEGFPNAVAETMLSATPNVVTDVGDAALVVGDTGWVVPPRDPERLADAVEVAYREFARSPDKWAERRSAARDRIVREFPLDRMIDTYEAVWRGIAPVGAGQDVAAIAASPDRKPLRVLHVINTLAVGGAETLLYRLVTTDPFNEHVVVSLGSPAAYSARLQERGILVHHLRVDSPGAAARGALRLNAIVRKSDADVVQCWMYRSNVFGGLIGKAAGKPVVWGVHNASLKPLSRSSRNLVLLSGMLARRTPDFVINCSARSAELHQTLGYRPEKAEVIYNGYDPEAFFPDEGRRSSTREALGISGDEFAIGCIARWDPLKDIPNLLAALRAVHDRGIRFRSYLIGHRLVADNAHLAAEISRLGCSDFVVPLGPRNDVQDLARALDLHVLASRTEAFPNVVAETMLSGTPNVVTDVGDAAAMVGSSGWVVLPRDPGRLAEAIVAAYSEWEGARSAWAARREEARRQIAENFSHERMAAAYERVWRKVAGFQ